MRRDIDDLIRAQAPGSGASELESLETEVWRRVGVQNARRASIRLTAGALVVAVMVGALGGGLITADREAAPSELRVLTVEAGLEPFRLTGDFG